MRLALVVAGLVLALDQLTKAWAQANLPFNRRVPAVSGWLSFVRTENTGATFGFLSGRNTVFIVVTAVLLLVIAALILVGLAPDRFTVIALGAILGGGLGNLLDRLRLSAVIDFIQVRYWPAVFNLADLAIRAGAVALVLAVLARGWRRRRIDRPSR